MKIKIIKFWIFCLLFFAVPICAKAAINTDTMFSYWKLDNNLSDASGQGNTGSFSGTSAPSYSTNVPTTSFPDSRSVNFYGTNSNITVSNGTGVQPTAALTFSMWVKISSYPGTNTIIGGNYDDGYPQRGYEFHISASNASFRLGNGSTGASVTSSAQLSLNNWHHLAGTWNGSTVILYLDGINTGSASFTGPIYYGGTSSFQLGNFTGSMDDIRLYSRALSAAEISDLAAGHHTSIMWDGSYSTDYENTENWNLGIIPDPYTLVTIPNVSNDPEFSTTLESIAGLQIDSGGSLNLHGYNLTINDAGVFSNNGNLILTNASTQVINGFINDTDSGTVTIEGTQSATNLKTGSTYYNLTMNGTGAITTQSAATVIYGNFTANSGTIILAGNMTVSGNIILNGGNLDSSTGVYSINLYGNWNRASGIFLPGNGTVTLNGTSQSITGSNDFYNLSKIASGSSSLTFGASSTQTIAHNLFLQGSVSSPMVLRSTTDGTQWQIDPQGARTLSELDVMDSYNANATALSVIGNNVTNSGNNDYWIFDADPPSITLDVISMHTSNTMPSITGAAVEYSGVVLGVQYQLETSSGSWNTCGAVDSSFNSASEDFTCIPATPLSEGDYIMYIRATDSDGYTTSNANLTVANFTVDLTSPVITSVSADPSSSKAGISWTTDEDASSVVEYGESTSYNLSRAEDTTGGVTSHSVSITGLEDCTNYHYRVSSVDLAGNETIGTDGIFKTEGCCEDPDKVDINSAETKDSTSITLSYDDVSGEVDHYELKYGTKSGSYDFEEDDIGGKDDERYTIKSLSPGTTYYFKIRAVNDCGKGSWSDEESATTEKEETTTGTETEIAENPTNTASTADVLEAKPATTLPNSEPAKPDFNGDTTSVWQNQYFGNPFCYEADRCGGGADPDGDGIINNDEFRFNSNPLKADTDNDGLTDNMEIESGRDPAKAATTTGSDEITYESAKEKGEVEKDVYEVKNVELVGSEEGGKKLKISGKGKPDSFVTIYIYSDLPTVLTIKTDKDGNWSYVLDKELADGEHQVYVAVTDNTGKITAKSEPLAFIKTAGAVTVIPPAEAANAGSSSVETRSSRDMINYIIIGSAGLLASLIAIGYVVKNHRKKQETTENI